MTHHDVILSERRAQRGGSRRTRANNVRANRCKAMTRNLQTAARYLLKAMNRVPQVRGANLGLLVTLALLLIPTLHAQDQQDQQNQSFTLKVDSDIVLTNVVVRDKKTGQVVKGLKQSDFTITENGKPQTIASFDYQNVDEAAVLQEKTTVTGKATIADLLNNDFAANPAGLKDHRLIVMFFDLSSMQPEDIDRA